MNHVASEIMVADSSLQLEKSQAGEFAIREIWSGGQTGVDRAALDVARDLGIPIGGWCPKGRLAEDGVISRVYPLRETPVSAYSLRTEWNVRDSDGTLILIPDPDNLKQSRGSALTAAMAKKHRKPLLILPLYSESSRAALVEEISQFAIGEFNDWVDEFGIEILNIAGPRESSCPGIHKRAIVLIRFLLQGN